MRQRFDRLARRGIVACTIVLCVIAPGAAWARGEANQDLSRALSELARRSNIELIFDAAQIAGIRVGPDTTAGPSPGATLNLLLAHTRFTYRQADRRTFVIVSREKNPGTEPQSPPPTSGPEIVVTGRLSQNVELVRGKDEIQPYWIASSRDIDASGATSLDDFLRTQVPTNRDATPLSQTGASPRSEVDLRGLGAAQTLVLVDGRRMAGVPLNAGLFGQSDINAIPVEAVDRVEVLSTAAGGIFGIGATGGAVNVVLKRDYDGLFLAANSGVSEHGDGIEYGVYGRFGWQSRNGRTKIMVSGSYAHDDGLLAGDRPYAEDARQLRLANDGYTQLYASNAVNIQSLGGNLSFTPAYGGASLNSTVTYLPLSQSALNAAGLASLAANAGKLDIALAPDSQGAQASLIAKTSRLSAMATVRQAIGDSAELFLDYLRFDNRGYQQVAGIGTANLTYVYPGELGNPFNQAIAVTFPTSFPPATDRETNISQRFTAGLIRHFGGGWSSEADLSYSVDSIFDLTTGGYPSDDPSVFSGVAAMNASIVPEWSTATDSSTDHLLDANLRVVGPFARLPGGEATITLTGEFRREWSAGFTSGDAFTGAGFTDAFSGTYTPYSQDVWSAFGEAHLPIVAAEGAPRPWRGLTAQLALRLDAYRLNSTQVYFEPIDNRASVPAITAGLQSRPFDGLMLRASYATGAMPPTPSQLIASAQGWYQYGLTDPERGGMPINGVFELYTGNTQLRPQETRTFSAGLVVEPEAVPGLRFSADYTRLTTSREIVPFDTTDIEYFIDDAAQYPGRVQRAPLTAADMAAGYTGGTITSVDIGPLQTGSSRLQTLDFALSDDLPVGGGKLHLHADADWALSYWNYGNPLIGSYNLVGYADGPIPWRVNLGAEWSNERWTIGGQGQLYAGYSLADNTPLTRSELNVVFVESELTPAQYAADRAIEPHVPIQDYFDLSVAFRPQGKGGMQIRLTVKNVFDKQPPIVSSLVHYPGSVYIDPTPTSGVASYGDVLGRRFSVNLRMPFGR